MYENNTVLEKEDDVLGSLYGSTVGVLFEMFYQERLWKNKDVCSVLEKRAPEVLDKAIKEATTATDWRPAGVIKWKHDEENPRGLYYDKKDILRDVIHAIPRGLQTIKDHKFIGKDVKAEMYLNTKIGGHTFGGRADFVMTRYQHDDLVILDGKGSRSKDRYVDETQLFWYALLLREKHGKFPDWVGFVFWKYESPYNVVKHEVTHPIVNELKDKALALMRRIEDAKAELDDDPQHLALDAVRGPFPPRASEDNCRFCPYATPGVCRDGADVLKKMEERQASRK